MHFRKEDGKKNGYQLYKFMDNEKRYIVSATIERGRYPVPKGILNADLSFHNVELNEFANFIHQYNNVDPPDIGLFRGFKIPISSQLRGWDSLPLVATRKRIIYDNQDYEYFIELCNSESKEIYDNYKYIENLAELYASEERWMESKDCLIIYLYMGKYDRVREIFHKFFGPDGRAASYIIKYMDRYGLN
ncbi:hypothetical protein [Consotaella aegiceratis]|uniref:hypothetical protein n=1 Tax=Consotaella aegiceratis TaxID=3097961 RepID=UPI002F3EE838